VLLNPAVGIAACEVKDWNLDAASYAPASGPDDGHVRVTTADGSQFRKQSPLAQARRYLREIASLIARRSPGPASRRSPGGVIFTRASGEGRAIFSRLRRRITDTSPCRRARTRSRRSSGLRTSRQSPLRAPDHVFVDEITAKHVAGWRVDPAPATTLGFSDHAPLLIDLTRPLPG
jgi:hypothetical protein